MKLIIDASGDDSLNYIAIQGLEKSKENEQMATCAVCKIFDGKMLTRITLNNWKGNVLLIRYATNEMDGMDEYLAYSKLIKENIDMESLVQRYPYEQKDVQEIYELILETVVGKGGSMTISGQQYPRELVRSRFLKLNMSHVEYVMECLRKNTTKIYNIKAYLLAALFNAGTTMLNYYRAEVNHDMPQFAG